MQKNPVKNMQVHMQKVCTKYAQKYAKICKNMQKYAKNAEICKKCNKPKSISSY
jgi:hypothetical protein